MLDTAKIKSKLTTEDIIKLCEHLQGFECLYDVDGRPIFSSALDHKGADSIKLYYYPESQLFYCYTGNGDTYDVFELVCRALECDFRTAFDYIAKFFGFKDRGFEDDNPVELTSDWDIFQKIQDYSMVQEPAEKNKPINENLLEYFYPLAAPVEWQKEGISPEVMYHYGIRVDSALQKIIIPHRDVDGHLIGIRGRTFDTLELDSGKKYMPVFIQGKIYSHKLGKNLFGLYDNKETIKRIKKVFVCEAEKSVMQLATMYGVDECWAVATCGSSFSKEQMNLLLELGVEEVVLGYDREFEGGQDDNDTKDYEDKLLKVVSPLLPYVNVSVIMDYDHLTKYKDSPTDRGKEIFEKLYHQRIRLYSYTEKITSRRKQ